MIAYADPAMQRAIVQQKIADLVQRYALPGILNYVEGKTEPQFHAFMKTNPDFVANFRRNNRIIWELVMTAAKPYKGLIIVDPYTEAAKVSGVIRKRGWKVWKREFLCFQDNISRLMHILNN